VTAVEPSRRDESGRRAGWPVVLWDSAFVAAVEDFALYW
jgi:hypothetical protein